MSSDKPKRSYEKLRDHIEAHEQHKKERLSFKDYFDYIESAEEHGILIEADSQILAEATRASVGRFTARRDKPGFAGDEYHGHCDVGGGKTVAWTLSGKRRHPSKFPAKVPHDAKAAIAKVLGISADLLEAFWIRDDDEKKLLFEATHEV